MKIEIYRSDSWESIKKEYQNILDKYNAEYHIKEEIGKHGEHYLSDNYAIIEINTLEDLINLQKEVKCGIILNNIGGLNLEIYDYYRE